MIVLLVRVDKFDLVDGCPRVTKVRRTYTAILLVTALWATAMASLFLDWPSDSTGLPYNKRYMVDQPISSSIDGPVWGCVAADLSFTYVPWIFYLDTFYPSLDIPIKTANPR